MEHLQGERDRAIIPFVFPSFWQRFADSTTRVWQLHNGAAFSRSDCRPPGNPFPPLSTWPKVHPRQVGRGRRCPRTSAAFASGQHPARIHTRAPGHGRSACPRQTGRHAAGAGCGFPDGLAPQTAARTRRAGEIRLPRIAPRCYLARAVAPGARPGQAARGAAGPGRTYFLMGPPGPLPRDEATAADDPACAPTRADFRTAAPRETRNGSSSPAPPRRAHAARTRGRTPLHPHSHALHTHGVSDPTLDQETAGSRHPARAPPSPPDSTPLLGRRRTRPLRPRAAEAARRPSRRPARSGFLSTARAPRARPRDEAGRKGRRHDWGWHRGSMTGATPLTHAPTHPSS